MRIHLALGSTSGIKLTASVEACRRILADPAVVPYDVASGVNAQPVGEEEIVRGARNRALGAQRHVPGSWGLGIENGIIREGGLWMDRAVAVLIAPDGLEFVSWSEMVEFPASDVAAAEAIGFSTTTVGAVIAERTGGAADDPHAYLTCGRRTRRQVIVDTVEAVLSQARDLIPEGETAMVTTHRIVIGGVTRDLPVREVAPGVRVALFNILGDWELTEAAGMALVPLLPAGIDAIVMPDGKATALLHVMGRESGLPTFVARKEKKPYMAEPVRKFAYRSITTDREQALYLGADDAVKLAGKRVVIADDVVSTGGTIEAMKSLMAAVGAEVVGIAAVLTEGGERADVIALGDLPLF